MTPEAFQNALSALLDNDLTPEQFTELEQYLQASQQARAQYLEYVDLHNVLDLELAPRKVIQPGTSNVVPIDRIIRRQNRRSRRMALFAAAAVLTLGLITMKLFFVDSTQPPALAFTTSPGTQFTISHTDSGEQAPANLTMAKGSRLQLSQGTVELTFGSGVKSIVMAPADLTLHDDDQLYLREGVAWFHVPEGAEGFQVNTQDLNIVDLGTKFGVIAHPDQHDEVHVLKGKVEVTSQRLRKKSATLTAGQSRQADPVGRLRSIPSTPSRFLTNLPKTLPHICWSFDQEYGFQASGNHPDVSGITTTQVKGPGLTNGKHGQALTLDGNGQYLVSNWPGFPGDQARTVTCWLRLPKDGDYMKYCGIVGWGLWQGNADKWKITVHQTSPSAPTTIRCSIGNTWIDGSTSLADGEWHHIAVTTTGELNDQGATQVEIYIDGKFEHTTPLSVAGIKSRFILETNTAHQNAVPLMIGTTLQHQAGQRFTLKGCIDELTIFDGHMTQQEVRQTMPPLPTTTK